jgi:tetratricopeptide (TPR) repeat protein
MKNLIVLFIFLISVSIHTCGQNNGQGLTLDLSVNQKKEIAVQKGFPLIFDLKVQNQKAAEALQLMMLFEEDLKTSAIAVDSLQHIANGYTIGSETGPWYENIRFFLVKGEKRVRTDPGLFPLTPVGKPVILLNGEALGISSLGMDPETSAKKEEGLVEIYAALTDPVITDTLWSNSVKVHFREPVLVSYEELTSNQLYFIVKYWLRRNKCDKAMEVCELFSGKTEDDILIPNLKAEIYECQGNDEEALKFYQEAFENYLETDKYEPPVHLVKKISELQEKLQILK